MRFPVLASVCTLLLSTNVPLNALDSDVTAAALQEKVVRLMDRLAADEARIKELEERLDRQNSPTVTPTRASPPAQVQAETAVPAEVTVATPSGPAAQTASQTAAIEEVEHEHSMELPGGGPTLKIRGFFDFNFGIGKDANPLIFPLDAPAHNGFQSGEFDLFLTSKLSKTLSFLGEIVIGSDTTNNWAIDIERLELTYKPSEYFQVGAGRFHTSIGYTTPLSTTEPGSKRRLAGPLCTSLRIAAEFSPSTT